MTKQTRLYNKHVALTGGKNMAEFAGYIMPLWYSSIAQEHHAVRQTAGMFDCTHMGVLDFAGPTAGEFLNLMTGNEISKLADGQGQYSFFFDENGTVLDDLIVYRQRADRFVMVVNASNDEKIQKHLAGASKLLAGRLDKLPVIRDLRAESSGEDRRLVLPVQGPKSTEVIASLLGDAGQKANFVNLGSFGICEVNIAGGPAFICRTGYCGCQVGYEFLVHPDRVEALWDAILVAGKDVGLLPCGLGSRDSLRVEAGLPLYGHELEGEHGISPFQAGYGWAVALDKSWFVGCEAVSQKAANFDMRIYRLELDGSKGVRPVREHDGILNAAGVCVGQVLSSAGVNGTQVVMALCQNNTFKAGDKVGGYYVARNERHIKQGKPERCQIGTEYPAELSGVVTKRFVKF
ncbi:MAG: hypothetical protein JW745_01810 [Sedimentisphaerales bacterium]|nr:hypothetical protein [Sedimentisphaerales bacterium]